MSLNPLEFREIMRSYATGVTVVTTVTKGQPLGITINSFSSVSLDPPTILFCLGNKRYLSPAIMECEQFVVNILAEDQQDLSKFFSQSFSDDSMAEEAKQRKFFKDEELGILEGTLGYLICKKETMIPVADHFIVLGRVIHVAQQQPKNPLIFFNGRYL